MRINLLLLGLSLCFSVRTQIIISEIHYDNAGGDVNERVEITGPAGVDLVGYSLELYNQAGSNYDSYLLSGVFSDQDDGFGTIVVLTPGIQNGGSDGLALIDDSGTVLEFLSYEGTTTAVGGPADGLTSTDIGVSEPGSASASGSLSFNGTNWIGPAANTFGQVNAGLANALPVTLTALTARPGKKSIRIEWATAHESGSDYFSIERSKTGADFTEIGRLRSAGTSGANRTYTFTDRQPDPGTNYYRLRQIDLDGTEAIYGPVATNWTGTGELSLFPNPTSGFVNLRGFFANDPIEILSVTGRTVAHIAPANGRIDLSTLRPGTYLLRVTTANGTQTRRLVKR